MPTTGTDMPDASQFLIPRGFRFGAVKAGLKKSGRTDFALIVADAPASAAAAFTANRVIAAPLIVDKEHLRASGGRVRVAAINAGNANCAAGEPGMIAARVTCAAAAAIFDCPPEQVFPSSTGIIGVPLPAEKLIAVLPALASSLGSEFDHFQQVAQAILTTDTVEKIAFAHLEIDNKEVRIAALCKGAGMIHPQLVPHATMLVYVLTDAAVEPAVLDGYLREAIEVSFNRISVDGDTPPTTPSCCSPLEPVAQPLVPATPSSPPPSPKSAPRSHARSSPTAKASLTLSNCKSTARPPTPTPSRLPRPLPTRPW